MTRTTRRSFIGKLFGTAVAVKLAPEVLFKETPGEVMGVLRRGSVTVPMNFICSGAFIPEYNPRNSFEVTTYRGAGEP